MLTKGYLQIEIIYFMIPSSKLPAFASSNQNCFQRSSFGMDQQKAACAKKYKRPL